MGPGAKPKTGPPRPRPAGTLPRRNVTEIEMVLDPIPHTRVRGVAWRRIRAAPAPKSAAARVPSSRTFESFDPMATHNEIASTISKLLRIRAEIAPVKELKKRGIRNVRIVRPEQLAVLIEDALEDVIDTLRQESADLGRAIAEADQQESATSAAGSKSPRSWRSSIRSA